MKIALVQESPVVGDFAGNIRLLTAKINQAASIGAELAVCSELALSAYPPRDYLERSEFVSKQRTALDEMAAAAPIPTLVGFVDCQVIEGRVHLFNAAAHIENGVVVDIIHKSLLPTYDVFDERRYFTPARERRLLTIAGTQVGVSICEDIWNDAEYWGEARYSIDPIEELVQLGAEILVNLSASPFSLKKRKIRRDLLCAQAKRHQRPIVFVNQVGAHDDLIFDGGSAAIDPGGTIVAKGAEFSPDLIVVDVDPQTQKVSGPMANVHPLDSAGEIEAGLDALILGVREYSRKCNFTSVLLGLSGGIDSALTAAIAAEALGPANVYTVAMPSRWSSDHSVADANTLAAALGTHHQIIAIASIVSSIETSLAELFADTTVGTTEENIQARSRGIILMALANKFGHLLLNTGNKSEISVGYCTLYGDMCGGLSVLSDVYKGDVYRMSKAINRRAGRDLIPNSTLTKPPSAELRPGQLDQDSLPPYEVLDALLEGYLENYETVHSLQKKFPDQPVKHIFALVQRAEFKRYQMSPGLKIRTKSFGPGRRMPIASGNPQC